MLLYLGLRRGDAVRIGRQHIKDSPTGDLAFICGANGQPLTKESFGNAGTTAAQLKALFGWTNNKMPSFYTRTADRRKLARDAIEKLTLNSDY